MYVPTNSQMVFTKCPTKSPNKTNRLLRSKRNSSGSAVLQMSPIQQGLQDAHPYVRRTAVMGVLKVYHLDKAAVLNAGQLEPFPFLAPSVFSLLL